MFFQPLAVLSIILPLLSSGCLSAADETRLHRIRQLESRALAGLRTAERRGAGLRWLLN